MSRNPILAFFALFAAALTARAQSAAAGALEGSVADAAGQRLAGARVTLLNTATGERHETEADGSGAFRFALVPAGTYRAEFTREGFQTARMTEYQSLQSHAS